MPPESDQPEGTNPGSAPLNLIQGESLVGLLPFLKDELEALSPVLAHQLGLSFIDSIFEEESIAFTGSLQLHTELVMEFPGLKGFGFAISIPDNESTGIYSTGYIELFPRQYFLLSDIAVELRLPGSLFTPVTRLADGSFEPLRNEQGEQLPVSLQLPRMDLIFDGASIPTIESVMPDLPLSLQHPVEISGTGIVIEVQSLRLPEPADITEDATFSIELEQLTVYLPGLLQEIVPLSEIIVEQAVLNPQGVSCRITTALADGGRELDFAGFRLKLHAFVLVLEQNTLIESDIQAQLYLPFIEQWVDLEIGWDHRGKLSLLLHLQEPVIEVDGLLDVEIHSIGFEAGEDNFDLLLESTITPKFQQPGLADIDWPSISSTILVGADGNISIDGGWIDLPEHYSFDLLGFQFELSRIGFGQQPSGKKWLGLNGAIQLMDELPAGAAVEGLVISWQDDDWNMSLEGIAIEFEVPNVLSFKGAVALYTDDNPRFEGQVDLSIDALDLRLDAQLVIGRQDGSSYMGLYLGVELPTAIPLFSTGLGLYGLEGLFVQNMLANKQPNEDWYQWYRRPQTGIVDITNASKWTPRPQHIALGLGLTLGTLADNGYTFSSNAILLFQFPGPLILFSGKAALLSSRQGLRDEPPLTALAVLDGRSGSFDIDLDASYRYWNKGELIDIGAHASAHFELDNPYRWHLYLGEKTPLDKRLRAEFLSFFTAESYFMLDASSLQMGARIGYDENWRFYPLQIGLASYLESHAALSFYPAHFRGELVVYGGVSLSAFGFGVGLVMESLIAADVFTPFELLGNFKVRINLPWPLDDLSAGVTLRWGEDEAKAPPIPLPLKEVAIEHFISSDSWPLARSQALLPNLEKTSRPGFLDTTKNSDTDPSPGASIPREIPRVPMDGKPHISFSRHVYDSDGIGGPSNNNEIIWEQVGDPDSTGPAKFHFKLESIRLYRHKPEADRWILEASSVKSEQTDDVVNSNAGQGSPDSDRVAALFGSWAPMPTIPLQGTDTSATGTGQAMGANSKLWLWSKNPFDYTRRGGSGWNESFLETFGNYPCIPDYEPTTVDYDFDEMAIGAIQISQGREDQGGDARNPAYSYPTDDFKLTFTWQILPFEALYQPEIKPTEAALGNQTEYRHALCYPASGFFSRQVYINLNRAHHRVEIILSLSGFRGEITPTRDGVPSVEEAQTIGSSQIHSFSFENTSALTIDYYGELCIYVIRIADYDDEESLRLEHRQQLLLDYLENWQDLNFVLQPYSNYCLAIETAVEVETQRVFSPSLNSELMMEHAYFEVDGPPGLARLSVPATLPGRESRLLFDASGTEYLKTPLNSLKPYIDATQPGSAPLNADEIQKQGTLIKPVYRCYDIDIRFSDLTENVGSMYQMARRKLSLVLYDKEGIPLHKGEGFQRIPNHIGNSPSSNIGAATQHWIDLIDNKTCIAIDSLQADEPISFSAKAPGPILEQNRLHRVALVPHLLDEDFSRGMGEWQKYNGSRRNREVLIDWYAGGYRQQHGDNAKKAGTNIVRLIGVDIPNLVDGLSELILDQDSYRGNQRYRVIEQNGNKLTLDADPNFAGRDSSGWTLPALSYCEHHNNPDVNHDEIVFSPTKGWDDLPCSKWRNYRYNATVFIEETAELDFALLFRVNKDNSGRVSFTKEELLIEDLDGAVYQSKYEELVPHGVEGSPLSERQTIPDNTPLSLALEVEGSALRVFMNGRQLVSLGGLSLPTKGGIGIKHSQPDSGNLKFLQLEVENFSANQSVFEFSLVSSLYCHFYQQVNDFRQKLEKSRNSAGLDHQYARSLADPEPIDETEFLSHDQQAQAIFGSSAFNLSRRLEIYPIKNQQGNRTRAFYLKTPEPLDPTRTSITLDFAELEHAEPGDSNTIENEQPTPGDNHQDDRGLVITDYYPGNEQGSQTHIELLLQDQGSLAGYQVEYLNLGYQQLLLATPLDQSRFLSDWQVIDEAPYSRSQSRWRVQGNTITQTSNYYGFTGGIINQAGTCVIAGDNSWENYQFELDIFSSDDDAIGAMFCYQDSNNYFRFIMDHERGFRRLVQKKSGKAILLWEDRKPFKLNQWINLRFTITRGKVKIFLDNRTLFKISNRFIRRGQVGLFCRANKGAKFRNIQLQSLGEKWLPLYRFDYQDEYPEGTRIALLANAGSINLENDVQQADLDDNFIVKTISSNTVLEKNINLRIRDNFSVITTQKSFLNDELYLGKTLRVLRKQDATALFLLPRNNWPDGNYRISLCYDRIIEGDNAALPASEIGERTPERARLYFQLSPGI